MAKDINCDIAVEMGTQRRGKYALPIMWAFDIKVFEVAVRQAAKYDHKI